jgi:aminoglycoside phosphotransferase (APT) family kinase protein
VANYGFGQEFAAERFAYPLLTASSVSVPRMVYAEPSNEALGWAFAIFEHVNGRRLDCIMRNTTTSQAALEGSLDRLATALSDVHRIQGSWFGSHTAASHKDYERVAFLETLFRAERQFLKARVPSLVEEYDRWVCDVLSELPSAFTFPTLVHGDIQGDILLSPQMISICWIGRDHGFDLPPMIFHNFSFSTFEAAKHCGNGMSADI